MLYTLYDNDYHDNISMCVVRHVRNALVCPPSRLAMDRYIINGLFNHMSSEKLSKPNMAGSHTYHNALI